MGTSTSADQFAGKLVKLSVAINTQAKPGIEAAALVTKQVFLDSLRISGVTGTTPVSRSVKARYDIKGVHNPTAIVRYTGPAHLLNNPTKPHAIVSKKNRGSRASRSARTSGQGLRGAIAIGNERYVFARHPGTKGLKFFQRAKPVAAKLSPQAYRRVGVQRPLAAIFK